VRNEPNFRRPRYPTIPIFHYSSVPVRCRLCKTTQLGRSGGARRANVRNEPNFADAERDGTTGARDEGQSCETNPIRTGAGAANA
jgi:hypothetical protein